jgi:hypothetical protein
MSATPSTVSTRRFTKEFAAFRNRPVQVTDRGRIVGTWTPAPKRRKSIDFLARATEDSAGRKLPFTFAQMLRETKKR